MFTALSAEVQKPRYKIDAQPGHGSCNGCVFRNRPAPFTECRTGLCESGAGINRIFVQVQPSTY